MSRPQLPRLAALKAVVTIEQVLARRGLLNTLRQQGDRLVGPCPIHHGDSAAAFVVNRSRNVWYCFTHCARGGDVIDLVQGLDASSFVEVARYLATLADTGDVAATVSRVPLQPRPEFRPFTRTLPLDHGAPLLLRKGIRAHTARRFEAGQYYGEGFLRGCLAVRIHDPDGRPLGYAGRRLDSDEARSLGKWKLPRGLPARSILYGFHHARPFLGRGLVVVECPWGVMRLAQLEIPAVALLGIQASQEQKRLLGLAPVIVLMLDGDPAGREATRRLQRELEGGDVRAADLPDGHDPDDLPDSQLRKILTSFLPDQPAVRPLPK